MAKKKNNKKELSPPERHFGVVLEDIDSKLGLVAEGVETLDKKIDRHYGEFQEFRNEVGERFKEVGERFKEVGERFNKVDERFNKVDHKFELVFDELRLIRNELKEKVGRDEFALLEKRVIALEKSRK